MSALDMVLQRQVPARPATKSGEPAAGADDPADARLGAFSAALSQEKRNAVAERDKNAVAERDKIASPDKNGADKTDAEAEGDEPDDQILPDAGQPDEILNLLAGLTSGAANSKTVEPEEAELAVDAGEARLAVEAGQATLADPRQAAALAPVQNGLADEATASLPAAANPVKPEATALPADGEIPAKAVGVKSVPAEARQASGAIAQPAPAATPVAAGQAVESPAFVRAQAPAHAAVVSVAAAVMAGKGAQAPAADAGQDRQKDPSSVKEVIRTLGLERGSEPAGPEVSESRTRGRNAGRQSGAEDRQIEERIGSKGGKVEVIESRRFMPAQTMSANTQLLTRSLAEAGSTVLAAQRTAQAQPAAQAGASQPAQMLHTLKLQLNPVSLGSVTAVLRLTGEELSVEIKVETAEAYRQLKDDNQSILKALRGQGFGVEQITVQHVAGPDRSSSQTPQQGFQGSQQGAESNDAQSSGKDSSRNSAGQQGSGPQGGQGHEQVSYAGSGAGRSDGVYL